MALSETTSPFVWGKGGQRLSPEQVARRRLVEEALLARGVDMSPVGHWTQGLARVANAAAGAYRRHRLDVAEGENNRATADLDNRFWQVAGSMFGGGGGSPAAPTAPTGSRVADNPNVGSTIDFARAGSSGGQTLAGNVRGGKGWTEIVMPDGRVVRREGARNWRNNNPGNIEFGPFAQNAGAIGSDGRFAVFPTYEAGRAAKAKLLFESPNYRDKTIAAAINRYAPPFENNTNAYTGAVAAAIGVDPNTPISALSPQQREIMLDAMQKVEGFKQGREIINGQAQAYAPQQVASLDQSIGMPAPEDRTGYDVFRSAPIAPTPPEAAMQGQDITPQPDPWEGMREVTGSPQQPDTWGGMRQPQQAQGGGLNPVFMEAMTSPNASPAVRTIAELLIRREMEQNDPMRQLQMQKLQQEMSSQADFKVVGNQLVKIGRDGQISDVTPGGQAGGGAFRFSGSSVEAQSLNGLMDSGQLTPEQAQQLGAGKTITGPNGEIIFLTPQGVFGQSPQGGTPQPLSPGTPQGGNIPVTPPKTTLDERKAMTFADRMVASGKILDQFEDAGLNAKDQFVRGNDWIPDSLENWMVGDDFQNFDQARRDFINAQLRRESGAVISNEEFANANQQYFPQPGDTKEVLAQKRRNRQTVIDGMIRDGGPTYRPNGAQDDPLGIR